MTAFLGNSIGGFSRDLYNMLNRMMTQKEQFVLLFVALAIALGALALVISRHEAGENTAGNVPQSTSMSVEARPQPQATDNSTAGSAEPTITTQSDAEVIPPSAITPDSDPAEVVTAGKRDIAVAVMGAVGEEGLYRLPEGARVGDLLKKAGGAGEDADLSDINQGAPLIDGSTLTVPRAASARMEEGTLHLRGAERSLAPNPPEYTLHYAATARPESRTPPTSAGGMTRPAGPAADPVAPGAALIDLNTATQPELETLPGIGPALALRIIEYRAGNPFHSVEQLDEVPGFGAKRIEQVRALVKVN